MRKKFKKGFWKYPYTFCWNCVLDILPVISDEDFIDIPAKFITFTATDKDKVVEDQYSVRELRQIFFN